MTNKEIANIIKWLCQKQNITISTLLSECSLTKSFIYDLEKRETSPSCEKITRIADYFNCSVDYLLGRTDVPEVNKNVNAKRSTYESNQCTKGSNTHMICEEPIYNTYNPIPVLGKVAAGTPILSYSSDFGTIVPENKTASYALIVQGDSMFPIILDKEYIEVTSQPDLEQGEIGIIMVDGDVTCKKFYNFKDHYELRSLNPDYATITVPKTSSTNLQILGKVSLTEAQMKRF